MNIPVKKGKYSMVDDESIQSCSTYLQQQKNVKQCEYVSNRTRLRCQNFKSIEELKDFGFCDEHQGYIERIRKEGLRTKHLFDQNFTISEGFLELISFDNDETLDSRLTTDFPFIYEPLYCESRLDGDENPLRNARILNKKEILGEYLKAIKRSQAAIREQRVIYREKHSKILRQGIRLAEQPNPIQIDPIKNTEKVERFNVMRRDALRLDQRQIFKEKFARIDTDLTKSCAEQRNKWLKQMQVSIDEDERVVSQLVTELVDLIVLTKSKRGPKTLLTPSAMHLIAKQNFKKHHKNDCSLPQTIVDILKGLKTCHFEEDLRKIKEEEEFERERLNRKIAIKMLAPTTITNNNNFSISNSNRRICSIYSSKETPKTPLTPAKTTTKTPTNLMNFKALNNSNNKILNNNSNFICSTNKKSCLLVDSMSGSSRPPLKRGHHQLGYFSTTNSSSSKIYSSQINQQNNQLIKSTNLLINNNADPHGYLPSNLHFSENEYLRCPSTSTSTLINNNGILNKNNLNKIIRPISIDEDINPDVFLQLTHPQLSKKEQQIITIEEEEDEEDEEESNTFVCARINLPWNGKRKTPFKKQQKMIIENEGEEQEGEGNGKNNNNGNINKNNNNVGGSTTTKTTTSNNSNNGYVQYVASVLSRFSTTL